jgi:Mrp family chromosome partitioning ATPase
MDNGGEVRRRVEETMAGIGRTLVVLSGKGGVGKSTVAVNLAVGLAMRGKKTGLLDTDLHGPSVPAMLGLENHGATGDGVVVEPAVCCEGRLKVMSVQFMLRNRHDSVIWRGPLKHSVIAQFIGTTAWGTLDYLIVDSPPGTGDEPLSVVRTARPGGAVVVTTPQEVATADVRKSIDFCRKVALPVLGVIENMSGFRCAHCGGVTDIFGAGGGKRMAEEQGVPFLGSIPLDPRFVTLSDRGKVLIEPGENSPALEAITAIVERVEKLEVRSEK